MIRLAISLALLLVTAVASSQPVRVAAAADLDFAMRDMIESFAVEQPDIEVRVQFGSSGKFYTQILQGLPVDLYFSADAEFPRRLEEAGRVEPQTRRTYAIGRLGLWVADRLTAQGLDPNAGPELLTDERVERLAIANPTHAPYGRAAVTLLEHYGLIERQADIPWDQLAGPLDLHFDIAPLRQGKRHFDFVYGENASQAAQLAVSGAGVGLVAASLALSDDMQRLGEFWLAPIESHLRLEQEVVVLAGQNRPEVLAFYEYVLSEPGRDILARFGFDLPQR